MKIGTLFGGVFELFMVPFLIEQIVYYKVSGEIEKKKGKIYELIYVIGEIDPLIGIASYKASNKEKICTPEFVEDIKINIDLGYYPLLEKPVANSIKIDNKGIRLSMEYQKAGMQ